MDKVLADVSEESNKPQEKRLTPLTLFKPEYLRSTAIITSVWVVANLGSFTLLYNGAKLSGDPFLNLALINAAYIPAGFFFFPGKLRYVVLFGSNQMIFVTGGTAGSYTGNRNILYFS